MELLTKLYTATFAYVMTMTVVDGDTFTQPALGFSLSALMSLFALGKHSVHKGNDQMELYTFISLATACGWVLLFTVP